MGKDLKGKELGVGIVQQANGLYAARFTDQHGKRQTKRFKKLQECRQNADSGSLMQPTLINIRILKMPLI